VSTTRGGSGMTAHRGVLHADEYEVEHRVLGLQIEQLGQLLVGLAAVEDDQFLTWRRHGETLARCSSA